MRKILVIVFLALLLVSAFYKGVIAASIPAPTPTSSPSSVNSYELFWPMVSGKSLGDSWYSLKIFKEKVRSFLIFGKAQKADYNLFLATKRLLEAEKLLNSKKMDFALTTLGNFSKKLALSLANWEEAKVAGSVTPSIKENLNNRLNNLNALLKYLSPQYEGEIKDKIDQGMQEVNEFLKSF